MPDLMPSSSHNDASARLITSLSVTKHVLQYLWWRVFSRCNHTSGRVDIDDGQLSYHSFGKGVPVFLLHGGLSRPVSWYSQIPTLVRCGHRVVLPASRGHGSSRTRVLDADYWIYADDVKRLSDHLALEKICIVGWSDGGNTGLHFALRYPERLSRLVVISANFHYCGIDMSQISSVGLASWRSWLHRIWLGGGRQSGQLVDTIHRLWKTQPCLSPRMLEEIALPVLAITGQKDCVSLEHARELTRCLPNAQHIEILGGGHTTPVTHADRINRLIVEFLSPLPYKQPRKCA